MEEEIYNTLDGGPERANIYFSQCIRCKHFTSEHTCVAFPRGIPESILYNMEKHDNIHPDQEGSFKFEKDD